MKKLFPFLSLLISISVSAQIPSGYYDDAEDLTGYELKSALSSIITTGHTAQSYGDLWDGYYNSDIDNYYEDDGTILDIYSENPNGTDPYNFSVGTNQCGNYTSEGDCYNREHLFPKSWFNDASPMYTDIQHIYPTDGKVNGQRSNYPFGEVSNADWTSQNGSKRGSNSYNYTGAYTGTVFEPIDEFKGDIARVYFYMATRYEDDIASWETNTSQSNIALNGTSDQVYEDWFLNMLLEWNAADPVSQKEIDRNNAAYNFQGNRNPYIDHPEYVAQVWGTIDADVTAPSTPTNLTAENGSGNQIELSWTASTDDTAVTEYEIYMDGSLYTTTDETSITTAPLASNTTYCFTVIAKDAAENASEESDEACATTPENSGGATAAADLIISEYVEGSGNNKALEIANFTGEAVNLDNYSLKLSSNGNDSWTANYTFPAGTTLNDSDVFVIANSGVSGCTDAVDDSNNSITGFNGNDAIGLFKNDVLIDILGTLGDDTQFAANVTLVRNANITTPNTTYTVSEWTTYDQNACYLGSHTMDVMSNESFLASQINVYPNPAKDGVVYVDTPDAITINAVEIYSLLGKRVLKSAATSGRINLKGIENGMYILQIHTNQGTASQKIMIQ